jgi:hypothetical protein
MLSATEEPEALPKRWSWKKTLLVFLLPPLSPMNLLRHFCIGLPLTPMILTASVSYIHVGNYFGSNQNPFLANAEIETVFLEDFENSTAFPFNYLNTPNATGWNGGRSGSLNAGVRQDYSPGDSDGGIGYYWTNAVGNSSTEKLPLGIHFDFSPDAQGKLPQYVGAALRGIVGASGDFNLILVFDRNGMEVTDGMWQIPKPASGIPIEDRFLNFEGIYVPGGISRIHFRDFREVDHLTYGYAIPEPSAAWLVLASGGYLLRRRARLTTR